MQSPTNTKFFHPQQSALLHLPNPKNGAHGHLNDVEGTVPNIPVVKDKSGEVLTLAPNDIIPSVGVFGPHEISELTKSPEKLTLLLERSVSRDPKTASKKSELRME